MRWRSNKGDIFEKENFNVTFFMFSRKVIRCSGLITDFGNICKCSKTQLCLIGEFLPGHILQMVILAKLPGKDRSLG